jgi:hypothetical protein
MNHPAVIDLNTVVVQAEGLLSSELDGETVLMSLARSTYYGLDKTARRIWDLTAQPVRVADLCDRLAVEYAVEPKTCEQDVCAFLAKLIDERLVRIVAEAGG